MILAFENQFKAFPSCSIPLIETNIKMLYTNECRDAPNTNASWANNSTS